VDTIGAADVVQRLRALEAKHGKRFAPAAMLVEYAEQGKKFFPEG
jgi:hypothetical protein